MTKANPSPEKAYQKTVIELLHTLGWATCAVHPLMTAGGVWRTPTSAVGWPDVTALRRDSIVAIEVKGAHTAIGKGQIEWLRRFADLATGHGFVVRPDDPPFDQLVTWLRFPAEAPKTYGFQVPAVTLLR